MAEVCRLLCALVEAAYTLTPRVAIVLYPTLSSPHGRRLAVLHEKVGSLAEQAGISVLDLAGPFDDLQGNAEAVWVSPYDGHPNATVHGRIAHAIFEKVVTRWPDIWQPRVAVDASRSNDQTATLH